MSRTTCSNCGAANTAFVQFGAAESDVTVTTPEDVGDGLLELRYCSNCGAGIENILRLSDQRTITDND